jgi:hypothetical protein
MSTELRQVVDENGTDWPRGQEGELRLLLTDIDFKVSIAHPKFAISGQFEKSPTLNPRNVARPLVRRLGSPA